MAYDFTSLEARKQRLEEGWFCEWKLGEETASAKPTGFLPLKDFSRYHDAYTGPTQNYIGKYTNNPTFDRFKDNEEVEEFIDVRAKEGSELHIAALTLLVQKKFVK